MAATASGHGLAAGVTALPMRLGKDPATHPFNVRSGCNDGPPPDGSSTSVNRFLGHAVKGQRARRARGAHRSPLLGAELSPSSRPRDSRGVRRQLVDYCVNGGRHCS